MISKRDIIKDEIEKIAQVFGHILAQLLGTDGNNPKYVAVGDLEEALQDKLDLDLKRIMALEGKELHSYLVSHHFDVANLELFGDLLIRLGKQPLHVDRTASVKHLRKGLNLYQLADAGSDAYSMMRAQKVKEVQDLLATLVV